MKYYETYSVADERRRCTSLECDMCKKLVAGDRNGWTTESYEILKTQIQMEKGNNFPEFGAATTIFAEICPACFMDRLVPWLESQGVKMQHGEWEV